MSARHTKASDGTNFIDMIEEASDCSDLAR
jgi:hypothetical protein